MNNWLSPVKRIVESKSNQLRDLAKCVGADPKTFYVGQDFSRYDLRGQDLRGLDLSGCVLDASTMDSSTLIDEQYDPRPRHESPYLQIALRQETYALALAFSDLANYTYKAWAIKALLETGVNVIRSADVRNVLQADANIRELYQASTGKIRRITVQVYPFVRNAVRSLMVEDGVDLGKHPYNAVILAALIRHALTRKRSLEDLDHPLGIFDGAAKYLELLQQGRRFISG